MPNAKVRGGAKLADFSNKANIMNVWVSLSLGSQNNVLCHNSKLADMMCVNRCGRNRFYVLLFWEYTFRLFLQMADDPRVFPEKEWTVCLCQSVPILFISFFLFLREEDLLPMSLSGNNTDAKRRQKAGTYEIKYVWIMYWISVRKKDRKTNRLFVRKQKQKLKSKVW